MQAAKEAEEAEQAQAQAEPEEAAVAEEELKSDQNQKSSQQDSYEVIDDDSVGAEEVKNKLEHCGSEFEHLSQFDPDDEFLQS